MAPTATSSTATETKPRNLFTVKGGANGLIVQLSKPLRGAIERAAKGLDVLANTPATFPKAERLADELDEFLKDPTAADEKET